MDMCINPKRYCNDETSGRPCSQTLRHLLPAVVFLAAAASATGDTRAGPAAGRSDSATQAVKNEAIELIGKLRRLEQELLYPAHTQVAVFLSVAQNSPAQPRSVTLKIDGEAIAHHVYTDTERSALRSGGIQRLYTGNIRMGNHKLAVSLDEILKDGSTRKQNVEYKFKKDENAEYIEIALGNKKPHVQVKSRN